MEVQFASQSDFQQHSVEQNVDIPVHHDRAPQRFVEHVVGLTMGGRQGFLPGLGSDVSSSVQHEDICCRAKHCGGAV